MPGPRPTPTAVLEARGSWRAKGRAGEPQFDPKRLGAWTTTRGRAVHWLNTAADALAAAGVSTVPDQLGWSLLCDAVEQYAMARDMLRDAEKKLRGAAFVIETEKGAVLEHPLVRIMDKSWDRIVRMLKEFGMTPAARTQLKSVLAGKPKEEANDSGSGANPFVA